MDNRRPLSVLKRIVLTASIKIGRHGDFILLFVLFVAFRLGSVWFFRPGGYTRDYSDLIYYQTRASWQDFGLLPYRAYWSEYPPLFAWFSVWVDSISRHIPLWEDARLWYAALFGLFTVAAEAITFSCLYWLARRLYGEGAVRVSWLYAGLFLPVYFLGGWFDAIPIATIFAGLVLFSIRGSVPAAVAVGLLVGVGGLLKLVPLALLAMVPLVWHRWRLRLIAIATAFTVVVGGYGVAYATGPVMTLTSLRSLVDRSGWSTLYALASGYMRLGKVVGDVFDPTANMTLYHPVVPGWAVFLVWGAVGFVVLWHVWHRDPAPQPVATVVTAAAFTYCLLLLAYPAWNPQYGLYLLPFLMLIWPDARGLFYALGLSGLILLEHPIYFNLIGPDYAPEYARLIGINYRQLLVAIISARTAVLLAIGLDLRAGPCACQPSRAPRSGDPNGRRPAWDAGLNASFWSSICRGSFGHQLGTPAGALSRQPAGAAKSG